VSNFKSAKDVYFDRLKLPKKPKIPEVDPNSKYAQAARLGLCFRCFREDTDPNHRPAAANLAFCKECMIEMTIGVDKLELQNKYEVHKWFK
jgi:hypothetical protein